MIVVGFVILGLAFVVDINTPSGYAVGAWYAIAILAIAASRRTRVVVAAGILSLALGLVAEILAPPAPVEFTPLLAVTSRVSTILVILLTTSTAIVVLRLLDRFRGESARDRTLIDIAADVARVGGWRLDVSSATVSWSGAVDLMLGTVPEKSRRLDVVLTPLPALHRTRITEAIDAAIQNGATFDETFELTTPSGRDIWVRAAGRPERDAAGQVIAVHGAVQDQTEQQLTLRARAEEGTMARMASTLGRMGAWRLDVDSFKLSWSAIVREIHEVPDDFVPLVDTAINFYAPEHRDEIERLVAACVSDGTPFDTELIIVTYTARRIWVRSIGEAVRDDAGRIIAIQGAFQDIDARKALEARLSLTLEFMSDGLAVLDSKWRYAYVNPQAEHLLKRTEADLLGTVLWEEFPEAVGSEFEVRYRRVASTGVAESFEARNASTGSVVAVSAYSLRDGIAVQFRDVTQQRALEEQLNASQRLEALGQLTGGVAHDFNNLLTVVMINGELLVEALADRPELRQLADMTLQASDRGAELTKSLLAFARRQALSPRPTDVNVLVAGMDSLLRRTLGEHVELTFVPSSDLRTALIDPTQLEGALLNLALNARDAMRDGGNITIETGNACLDAAYAETNPEATPGEYVLVAVSDTGTGIDPEHLGRVFDPFFTTKGQGEGTGLGLSMVYGFVKQSAGHVKIYSEPGEGTTVRLYLPLAMQPADEPEQVLTEPVRGTETILLVEDDEAVRANSEGALTALGYRVLTAVNGPEALGILRNRDGIDLLFTDIVMPGGMNGRQLADAAALERPGLPVLYTSGYAENAIIHHGRLDPGVRLLSKPYKLADLARALRQALDAELT